MGRRPRGFDGCWREVSLMGRGVVIVSRGSFAMTIWLELMPSVV